MSRRADFADFEEPYAPRAEWSEAGKSEHFVQLYEDDAILLKSLSGFVAAGLRNGETTMVTATKSHRDSLQQLLDRQGIDLNGARARGFYIPLDAADTLERLTVDGEPDERLFSEVIGEPIARLTGSGRPLRIFGEMVALLWEQVGSDAAIRLEELWNELAEAHPFCLYCAYPMSAFSGERAGAPLVHVCKAHSRVIPAEANPAKSEKPSGS